jgi:dTDP-4-amino-4,6-dideoxygalactose transaminase
MINVTKSFLPPFEEYTAYLKRAWDKAWLTNNGELSIELEKKLGNFLGTKQVLFAGNGTIVLQLAIKALGLSGDIITTPFSYVATTNAILWEHCNPVFVDIDPHFFCIDPEKIEAAITKETTAILATHVYGLPCDVEAIEAIARKHNLYVIYDGAHAFGTSYKGKQLLTYGDIATCSFHATKLFHTVEGGLLVCNEARLHEKLFFMRSFGHKGDEYYYAGINGKNSEFHAAMGLAVLPYLNKIIQRRKEISQMYDQLLSGLPLSLISFDMKTMEYNYAYYPVIFESEISLLQVFQMLQGESIYSRRYFYPSLNKLAYLPQQKDCPISEDLSRRVLCLPLYPDLEEKDVARISRIIKKILQE